MENNNFKNINIIETSAEEEALLNRLDDGYLQVSEMRK
jgi:hypothetical protein